MARSKPMHDKKNGSAPVQSMANLVSLPGRTMVNPTSSKSKTPKYKKIPGGAKANPSRKSVDLATSVNDISSNPVPGMPKGTTQANKKKVMKSISSKSMPKGTMPTVGHRGTGNPFKGGQSGGFFR